MKKLFTIIMALTCAVIVNATDYYVAGDGNGSWCDGKSWVAAGSKMTDNGDGTYSITFTGVAAGYHQFKVTDGTWNNNWGYDNVADKTDVENAGDGNVKFNCAAGNVTINFVESTKSISVSFVKGGEIAITSWTIAGVAAITGNAWSPADESNDMTDNGDGTWTLVKEGLELAAASYEYKVVANHAWGVSDYPESGNNVLNIPETGKYTITFTWTPSSSTLSANALKTGDAVVKIVYYIKNNWNNGDWNWQEMAQEGAVYTYTGVFGDGGGVNINTSAADSDSSWFPLTNITAGDYAKFTYDPEEKKVSAVKVTADITVGEYGYATYVTPCALDFTESGVTAYAVTPDLANNKVTLTAQTQVPAGKAIVVKAEQGTHTVPAIASAADFDTALEVSATATAYDNVNTYYYLGVDNGTVGFRPLAEGGEIAAGKCFFKVAKGGSAKFLTFAFDDEATGINNVNASTSSAQAIYNLAGQRVNANAKGIVIKNGRKFINK